MTTRERPLHEIDEDEFLAGPDRYAEWQEGEQDDDLLDIDWIFGNKGLDSVLADARHMDGGLDPEPGTHDTPAFAAPGYAFRQVGAGVLLIAPTGEIAGGYLGCDVVVDPEHQGQGLGAELILERYLRDGDLPTWWLDAAAYSPAGEAAHRAAWHLLQDAAVREAKLAIIDAE